jgi:hypothetical protein
MAGSYHTAKGSPSPADKILVTAPVVAALLLLPRLPFFHRDDHSLRTLVLQQSEAPCFEGQRVAVLEFSLPPAGEPAPPDFGELLRQQLLAAGVTYRPSEQPDVIVQGGIETLFRRTTGGLVAKVRLRVTGRDGDVLWDGLKHAEWRVYIPLEDCLRTLAASFVSDLQPPRPKSKR